MSPVNKQTGVLSCLRVALAAFAALSLQIAVPSSAADFLTVRGELSVPYKNAYSLADLQNFGGAIDVNIGTDVYTGVSLWSLLGGTSTGNSAIMPNSPPPPGNPILRSYVKAIGSGAVQSLISVGEINPRFGGGGFPFIVAYELNDAPLTAPMLIHVDDPIGTRAGVSGTRSVSALTTLEVASVSTTVGSGGLSEKFALSGVDVPGEFDLAALKTPSPQVPATTVLNDISFVSGANPNGPHDYTGVRLWDLLTLAGIDHDRISEGYLMATGSDGYRSLFALGELDPARNGTDVLIAYGSSAFGEDELGDAGFARLVVPGDLQGGRYVSNLASLEVGYVQAVPEAQTWAMMLAGLALVGLLGRRLPARS